MPRGILKKILGMKLLKQPRQLVWPVVKFTLLKRHSGKDKDSRQDYIFSFSGTNNHFHMYNITNIPEYCGF